MTVQKDSLCMVAKYSVEDFDKTISSIIGEDVIEAMKIARVFNRPRLLDLAIRTCFCDSSAGSSEEERILRFSALDLDNYGFFRFYDDTNERNTVV